MRIPNSLIRTSENKSKLYVYIILLQRVGRKGIASASLKKIASEFCEAKSGGDYRTTQKIRILLGELERDGYLQADIDLNKVRPLECIDFCVTPIRDHFTKFEFTELDKLMAANSRKDKAKFAAIFLYVKFYIGIQKTYSACPAYTKCVQYISDELGISKPTVLNALKALVEHGLLVKHETGYRQQNEMVRRVPNIYVLNNQDSTQQIAAAIMSINEERQSE